MAKELKSSLRKLRDTNEEKQLFMHAYTWEQNILYEGVDVCREHGQR